MTKPEFIIERHRHGWLVKPPPNETGIPVDALPMCLPLFEKKATMWPGIANATRAIMAVPDSRSAGKAWEAEIAEALEKSALPPELKWLRGTDTGASSKTLFFHLCGHLVGEASAYPWKCEASGRRGFDGMTDVPHDAADFGRCSRLLAKFPAWRERLPEMAVKLPHTKWPKLVAIWHELEQLDTPMKHKELTERIRAL